MTLRAGAASVLVVGAVACSGALDDVGPSRPGESCEPGHIACGSVAGTEPLDVVLFCDDGGTWTTVQDCEPVGGGQRCFEEANRTRVRCFDPPDDSPGDPTTTCEVRADGSGFAYMCERVTLQMDSDSSGGSGGNGSTDTSSSTGTSNASSTGTSSGSSTGGGENECFSSSADFPTGLGHCDGEVVGTFTNSCSHRIECRVCPADSAGNELSSGGCHLATLDGGESEGGELSGHWWCGIKSQFGGFVYSCESV